MTDERYNRPSRNRDGSPRPERRGGAAGNRSGQQRPPRQRNPRPGQKPPASHSLPADRHGSSRAYGSSPRRVHSAYSRDADTYRNASERRRQQSGGERRPPDQGRRSRTAGPPAYPEDSRTRSRQRRHAADGGEAYQGGGRYSPKTKRKRGPKPFIAAAALVVAAGIGLYFLMQNTAYAVTVNGAEHEFRDAQTIAMLIEDGFAQPQPGDLMAIDGSLLAKGKGEAFSATVNGKPVSDPGHKVGRGDTVVIDNGRDTTEPATESTETVEHSIVEEGSGPLHVFEGEGADGVTLTRTGSISGITVSEEKSPVSDQVFHRYFPDVGNDKVVAITFDDGPWPESTSQILSVLKENGAKATFFTVGECIDDARSGLVKQASDAGHQVCTHTYSHARGKGGSTNLGAFTAEEQVADVQKGMDAIEKATGKPASKAMRAPGGSFKAGSQQALCNTITAEIGWTVDTADWKQPGAQKVADQIAAAKPGDIILMHDGGGNRNQTIDALKIALPKLKAQGFRFITIDEMLQYPPK